MTLLSGIRAYHPIPVTWRILSTSPLEQVQIVSCSWAVDKVESMNVDHHGDDSESEASEDDWMVDGASDDDMSGGCDND